MAARRLEDQAALLERRLSALDAAHGDEARISAAREATLGQLKAMTSEINNQKFLLAPKAAADDEQEGLPRCRWGAVLPWRGSVVVRFRFGEVRLLRGAVSLWRSSAVARFRRGALQLWCGAVASWCGVAVAWFRRGGLP